jgi:hypothetical protein
MRAAVTGVLLLIIFGIVAGTYFGNPPSVGTLPVSISSDLDFERRALRYESVTVTDGRGASIGREILILGPASRILTPWLHLEFGLDAIELVELRGETTRVPDGTATAVWQEGAGRWHFSPERFDPENLPNVKSSRQLSETTGAMEPKYGSLPEGLLDVAPERKALIDRAFPPEATR